jgi:hypothetical protein
MEMGWSANGTLNRWIEDLHELSGRLDRGPQLELRQVFDAFPAWNSRLIRRTPLAV